MLALLRTADLVVEGQLVDASNVAVRAVLDGAAEAGLPARTRVLYKPIRGERPLWDFPDGSLAAREVAAYLVSRAGGWGLVPPTVLRDGPFGPGSTQLWIESPGDGDDVVGDGVDPLLELFDPQAVPPGWLPVLRAELAGGGTAVLAHRDVPDLLSMAVLDVVLNNADRKGSHVLRDGTGRLWGFDHGVTLHRDPKLRTVLWGWAGEPVPAPDLARLRALGAALEEGAPLPGALGKLLEPEEVQAVRERVAALLAEPVLPAPLPGGPAIPWPPW